MNRNWHTRRARIGALVIPVVGLLGLGACSDDEPDEVPTETTQAPTAQDRLEQAREVLTEAGSVHLTMVGENLPEELDAYVISADGSGTMEPPAFEGTITAKVAGIQADVPTVAVDDQLYVQLPFTPGYISTSPEALNVPDPAQLFDVDAGVVSLLSKTEDAEFGEQSREGREIVQEVTGTLPGQAIIDLLSVGDEEATFEVTYALVEEDWQVRTVTLTGPFYPQAESTYTVTLDQYGEPVTVTAP
ncbi:MAG: LppX_LprAFG lipoprotein [Actinomycetota bacterium]|nr:LppX_LprAFG lipoprotein [Actinomycetota bacterium]